MECGENEVSGQGCIYGDGCGLFGSGFSDEDDVRILSEDGFEAELVGIAFFIIDLRLLETCDFVFDWIFKGDDLFGAIVEFFEGRVEGCGFSRSGWTCDNNDSCRLFDIGLQK